MVLHSCSDLIPALDSLGIGGRSISGAILDCGPSLSQLNDPKRGFSTGLLPLLLNNYKIFVLFLIGNL